MVKNIKRINNLLENNFIYCDSCGEKILEQDGNLIMTENLAGIIICKKCLNENK